MRSVCCGYRDINDNHVLCSDPVLREMWLNKLPNDSHGPCDSCLEKQILVYGQLKKNESAST